MDWVEGNKWLTHDERLDLEEDYSGKTKQELGVRSTTIWTWIGENMSQIRSEPQVAPPMYVRLLFLCQDCMAQVEDLKTNLTVQIPFTYAHLLSLLVHLSNVLLAISCGLAFGSAIAEITSRQDEIDASGTKKDHLGEYYEAVQVIGMQIVILIIQPLLYQSFLVIAHALCYPYGEDICHMPTETFIQQMHYELKVMGEGKANHKLRRALALADDGKKKKDDEDDEDDDDDG